MRPILLCAKRLRQNGTLEPASDESGGVLECRVVTTREVGQRALVIGQIIHAETWGRESLVYRESDYHGRRHRDTSAACLRVNSRLDGLRRVVGLRRREKKRK